MNFFAKLVLATLVTCSYPLIGKELTFLKPENNLLREKSKKIPIPEIRSEENQKLIQNMFDVARGKQGDKKKGVLVGLAAPQVGILKRVILVDVGADGRGNVSDLRAFINPEIIWTDEEQEEWYEGCLSAAYQTGFVCGIVSRPKSIRVSAWNEVGEQTTQTFSGYVARVFQHEIDHLNGIEFTQRVSNPENLHWVEQDEIMTYRKNDNWKKWPKKCPREKWIAIKNGELG